MIKSMTGFGRAEAQDEQHKFTVEIKSVNHRYLDFNIKMPKKLSFFDMLTGLYNRNRYIERLEAYKQVQDQQIGAIYIDLNGLKKVNDEQGHRAGDELIVLANDGRLRHPNSVWPFDAATNDAPAAS